MVNTLVREGVDVRVLVRPTSDTSTFKELDVEVVCGDLTDQASVRKAVQGVDLLFHVAADYRLWVPDPKQMHAINVDGTVQILRAARQPKEGICITSARLKFATLPYLP